MIPNITGTQVPFIKSDRHALFIFGNADAVSAEIVHGVDYLGSGSLCNRSDLIKHGSIFLQKILFGENLFLRINLCCGFPFWFIFAVGVVLCVV